VCCCLQRMLPPTWARQGANNKTVQPDTLSANLVGQQSWYTAARVASLIAGLLVHLFAL
jgi:hypothetical protein